MVFRQLCGFLQNTFGRGLRTCRYITEVNTLYVDPVSMYNCKIEEINYRIRMQMQNLNPDVKFSNFFEALRGSGSVNKTDGTQNAGYAVSASAKAQTAGTTSKASASGIGLGSSFTAEVAQASQKYGLPVSLINAVIQTESGFNASAVSGAGAIGLMQLMPSTASYLNINPYDPAENIDGGVRYLKNHILGYNGNLKMALAAYNCGSGTLSSLGITNLDDPAQFSRLPKETQGYITKIMDKLK